MSLPEMNVGVYCAFLTILDETRQAKMRRDETRQDEMEYLLRLFPYARPSDVDYLIVNPGVQLVWTD